MFAEVPLFPERASTIAHRVDNLLFFLLTSTGIVGLGVCLALIYFAIRYRRRNPPRPTPRILEFTSLEVFWSVAPFFVFLVMFVWGARIYLSLAQPPRDALDIYVVGKQWMWKLQHPGGQREINELHVPVGKPVKLTMTAEDVIHSFYVPAFRIKADVLPGRYVYTWFQATVPGRYHLFCAEYCGTNHAGMRGEVVVMDPADYQNWLNRNAEGSLALEGRKLFLQLQCISCHVAGPQARAPVLEDLYGHIVPLRGGANIVADDNYIRNSVLKPASQVVLGWEPIMPTFEGQVSEEDLIKLIAFIKSLGPGQTPQRNEESNPPAPTTAPPEPAGSPIRELAPPPNTPNAAAKSNAPGNAPSTEQPNPPKNSP